MSPFSRSIYQLQGSLRAARNDPVQEVTCKQTMLNVPSRVHRRCWVNESRSIQVPRKGKGAKSEMGV